MNLHSFQDKKFHLQKRDDKNLFVCTEIFVARLWLKWRDYIQKEGLGGKGGKSCATTPYYRGSPPDPRAIAIAKQNGVDLSAIRSRSLHQDDSINFPKYGQ